MSATIDLTNAKPCPGCRRMLTTEPKCCHCSERDALRAELAAEKSNASMVETWAHQARKAADEDGVQFVGPNTIFAVSDKLRAERDRLAADNARLRKALQPFADRIKAYPPWMWTAMIEREKEGIITGGFTVGNEAVTHMPAMLLVQAEEALAATPAQSLAAHDAALLREVAGELARIVPADLEAAADVLELIAWAEEAKLPIERLGSLWWVRRLSTSDTLLGTLRRAREAAR